MAAILKMVLSIHLGRGPCDFDEIWCRCKCWYQELSHNKKSKFCKYYLQRSPNEKRFMPAI